MQVKLSAIGKAELSRISSDYDDKAQTLLEVSRNEEDPALQSAIHSLSVESMRLSGTIKQVLAMVDFGEKLAKGSDV